MRPPGRERRPATQPSGEVNPRPKKFNETLTSRSDVADFDALLGQCVGLDDPRWRAVELVVDAWQPALAASYRLGHENGHAAGYGEAERDDAEGWRRMAESVRRTLAAPRHKDLSTARQARVDTPCQRKCDRCSRCVRAAAVRVNRTRYGQDDYPGAVLARGVA